VNENRYTIIELICIIIREPFVPSKAILNQNQGITYKFFNLLSDYFVVLITPNVFDINFQRNKVGYSNAFCCVRYQM